MRTHMSNRVSTLRYRKQRRNCLKSRRAPPFLTSSGNVCVAVCCSVLQCVAVCCSGLHCTVLHCVSDTLVHLHFGRHQVMCVLQYVAVCCSGLQRVAVFYRRWDTHHINTVIRYVVYVMNMICSRYHRMIHITMI